MGERCREERREERAAEGEMEGDIQSTAMRRNEGSEGRKERRQMYGINKAAQKKNRAILQKALVG